MLRVRHEYRVEFSNQIDLLVQTFEKPIWRFYFRVCQHRFHEKDYKV